MIKRSTGKKYLLPSQESANRISILFSNYFNLFHRQGFAGKFNRLSCFIRQCRLFHSMDNSMKEFNFVARVINSYDSNINVQSVNKELKESNVEGINTQLRALVESGGKDVKSMWFGNCALEEGLTSQWLSLKSSKLQESRSKNSVFAVLDDMNKFLHDKSFLVSHSREMLADLSMFWSLRNEVTADMIDSRPSLVRWFDHMQHLHSVRLSLGTQFSIVPFSLPSTIDKVCVASTVEVPAESLVTHVKKSREKKVNETKKVGCKEINNMNVPVVEQPPEISKLDIRVGLITKCWKHENSEKLFCEEINVGESEPRPIASGLNGYYKDASELQGRKVLVLCNLKPRNLGGYKSNGMILCTVSEDRSKVEVVEPPADAVVGEKVTFEGLGGNFEVFTPAQVAKKKVFESVAPNLKSDDKGRPYWQGPDGKPHKFMTSAGECKPSTITNGIVS